MAKRAYYTLRGTYRNWGIYQFRTNPDFIANMRLDLTLKGSDRPDLEGDVSEAMRSTLAAFESQITKGPRPSTVLHSPIPSTPTTRREARIGYHPTPKPHH